MASYSVAPFDQVNQEIQHVNEDHFFWWGALGRSFASLLSASQYCHKQQLQYLRWFYKTIAPSLGPRPTNGKPHYAATFTYDGSPFEYSLNWKEKKASQIIRFTTEPSSLEAGTAADPFNQLTAKEVLKGLTEYIPGLDLTRFTILLSATNVPNEAADEVSLKLLPRYPRVRVLLAYDLEDGGIIAKAYLNPGHKAYLQGTPTKNIAFDAIRECNGPAGSYDASITAVDDYLESFTLEEAPQVFLLSNDCVSETPSSRIKVYAMARVYTLAMAKDMFHLGGRLSSSAIADGLKHIQEFWYHVFGPDSSEPGIDEKEVLSRESRCIFVYELRPTLEGSKEPEIEVKMHVPGNWLGRTDAQISEVLSDWFQKHGHSELAARYQSDLASAL